MVAAEGREVTLEAGASLAEFARHRVAQGQWLLERGDETVFRPGAMVRAMPIKPAFIEQSAIRGQSLQLRVKTEDLGHANRGGARLFDAKGHTLDVPLTFTNKAGADDVFTGKIPTRDLKARGFDLKTLQATAFVDAPGAPRIWEEHNHPAIVSAKDDALRDLGPGNMRSVGKQSLPVFSGKLDFETVHQGGPMTGSHTASWETAVTAITYRDEKNFFGGAKTVKLELHPEHTVVEMGPLGGAEISRPGVEDLNAMAIVTLHRQADGSYKASAPANKAFFSAFGEQGMAADALTSIKVALFDPKTGKEDSAFGQDYALR